MTTAVVIVAAGRGMRAGGGIPKQWRELAGESVLARSVAAFRKAGLDGPMVIVHHPDERARAEALAGESMLLTAGGDSRGASVLAGLEALAPFAPDKVLIHDAARPLVSTALIHRVIDALDHHAAAAPAMPVTDALWRGDTFVTGTEARDGLWRAQTPQGFHFDAILAAHASFEGVADDDVAVARDAGLNVAIVPGDEGNLKITAGEDFARAERLLGAAMDVRTGNGFDVHRFCDGDHLWLCGVRLPFSRGLEGHSDADVGMHAVTDAVYGAMGAGDIGQHFPPGDPRWKGAASHLFLEHACRMARERGFQITHADCTLICEYPKIGPHAAEMKDKMSKIMNMDRDRISVKATTSERLGFTGRSEGIAALATATLVAS